ncbi:MAG: oligosaccharide flippase family protein [Tunicatimonas sp.]
MANPLKQLAGQTALYGGSTIVGRVLTYVLVPLHTSVLETTQYGEITELYTYVAFFNILYTFGMETAFFRFVSRPDEDAPQHIYRTAFTAIFLISTLSSALLIINADAIAALLGYAGIGYIIRWLAIVLWVDAIVAIPFARLRIENRPLRFAVTKITAISITVFLNFFLLLWLPQLQGSHAWLTSFYRPDAGVGYVFLANLIGNAIIPVLLWPYLRDIRFRLSWRTFQPMLWYAFPIFIMGIGGMVNENIEKLLLNDLLPTNFYPNTTPQEALGAYGACFKLTVFMTLAIQAFRYAGEPFFFSNAQDKESPKLFAQVMHYFTVFSILILVGVSVNLTLIGTLFLRSEAYWTALYVVPFLLVAKLLAGVYINLSIWFKLTDKTYFGTIISIVGAAITLGGNILLIPVLGYLGSALSSIGCYLIMCLVCYYFGRKYYPIPYNFAPTLGYLVVGLLVIYGASQLALTNVLFDNLLKIAISLTFAAVVFFIEKNQLQQHRNVPN